MSNTFSSLGLAEPISRAVSEMGYASMTPIQAQAIPVVLTGKDVMGAAQTGTGKTAAFSLPLLQKLMRHENASTSPARHPVRALVLLPTRELADQVAQQIKLYAQYTQLRSAVVFGGMDMKPQTAELKRGVEVLVATPGRPMGQLLRAQLQANPANAPILEQAEAAIAELEAGRRVDVRALDPALRPLFHPRLQGFLIATLTLDPARYMAGVDRPVLVLQGTRDLQVPMGDAEMLARSAPQAVLVRLADTNHVLKQVSSDDVHENLATYGDAQRPLAPGVVDSVLRFLAMPGPSR